MFKCSRQTIRNGVAAALVAGVGLTGIAGEFMTTEQAHVSGIGPYKVQPLFTVGETVDGYTPAGILDGLGALLNHDGTVNILANHELGSSVGYAYPLANGTWLKGGRISSFTLDPDTLKICGAGLAYDTICGRDGAIVEGGATAQTAVNGLNRPCSARSVAAGEYGFVDDIFFSGEETGGGTEYALDVQGRKLYAAPAMGVAAWENVTPIAPPGPDHVAILVGDDRAPAPLILYVGEKNAIGDGSFLDRNGLAVGKLYVWVADSGDTTPDEFNGGWNKRAGTFVEIDYYRPDLAGNGEYDDLGYADQDKQDDLAVAAGAFLFSRPEDVHDNPANGKQIVMTSTGRGQLYPSDDFGTIYTFTVEYGVNITAEACILYDGDDEGNMDFGIRSPDNLVWAEDGYVYVQEDRSTFLNEFGGTSGAEASIWKLDPTTGHAKRIAMVNRAAVLPEGQVDTDPDDLGDWETSGILDVSDLLRFPGNQTVLLAVAQSHSVREGAIGELNLGEGGQLFLMSKGKGPLQSKLAKSKGKSKK